MIVPYEELTEEALRGIIKEFVLREGTEYGSKEIAVDTKVAQVLKQLERREALVVFDPETETCNIIPR